MQLSLMDLILNAPQGKIKTKLSPFGFNPEPLGLSSAFSGGNFDFTLSSKISFFRFRSCWIPVGLVSTLPAPTMGLLLLELLSTKPAEVHLCQL
jgi:hypothetical protein